MFGRLAHENFLKGNFHLEKVQGRMRPLGIEGDLVPELLVETALPYSQQILLIHEGWQELVPQCAIQI